MNPPDDVAPESVCDEPELLPEPLRIPAGLPQASSLPKQVALLAIWPFLEQLLGFLVGFVDTAVAGHLSTEATNAIGVAAYVLWLMGLLNGALGVGASALVARYAGAGRFRHARQIVGQALVLAVVWGGVVGLCMYVAAPYIAAFSGLRGVSLEYCTNFLRILAVVGPCNAVLGIANACLRASGDTRAPFAVMVLVNVVNAAGSLLLALEDSPLQAYGLGGMGVSGIGIAAALAWVVGLLGVCAALRRRTCRVRAERRLLVPRLKLQQRIFRIGLPNLLENAGHWVGNFLVIAILGHLPDKSAIGAHTVAVRIEALSFLPGFAMGIAAAPLIGQYLGAQQPKTARAAVNWCWGTAVVIMSLMGVFFILWPEFFARIVTNQPELLATAPQLLFITGFIQAPFASYLVLSHALRGAGDTRSPLVITLGATFLIRLPLAWYFGIYLNKGVQGVWIGLSTELALRGLLFTARYMQGKWERVKV